MERAPPSVRPQSPPPRPRSPPASPSMPAPAAAASVSATGGAARLGRLHFFPCLGGVDGDGGGGKSGGFAEETGPRGTGLRIGGRVSADHDARRLGAPVSDVQERSPFQVGDFLFV